MINPAFNELTAINITEPQHWLHHDRDYSGWHAATCQCYGCRCYRDDEPLINTLAKMNRAKEMRRRIEEDGQ